MEYVTKTGRVLTEADIEALVDEAERGYCTAQIGEGRYCFKPMPCAKHP